MAQVKKINAVAVPGAQFVVLDQRYHDRPDYPEVGQRHDGVSDRRNLPRLHSQPCLLLLHAQAVTSKLLKV